MARCTVGFWVRIPPSRSSARRTRSGSPGLEYGVWGALEGKLKDEVLRNRSCWVCIAFSACGGGGGGGSCAVLLDVFIHQQCLFGGHSASA